MKRQLETAGVFFILSFEQLDHSTHGGVIGIVLDLKTESGHEAEHQPIVGQNVAFNHLKMLIPSNVDQRVH